MNSESDSEPEQDDKFQVNTCDLPKNDSDSDFEEAVSYDE